MTTVKFDKSVKYKGVRYDAHVAFAVEDSDVDQLKQAGATVLAVETVAPASLESESPSEEEVDGVEEGQTDKAGYDVAELKEKLLEYTVSELQKFAKDNNIHTQGKTRKADLYNIIVASLN